MNVVHAHAALARAFDVREHLGAAERVYREVVHYTPQSSGQQLADTAFAHIGLGQIAYVRHDLAGAPDQIVTGVALVRQSQGSDAEALALVGQAEQIMIERDAVGERADVAAVRARVVQCQAETAAVIPLVPALGVGLDTLPHERWIVQQSTLAHLLLAQGYAANAGHLDDSLINWARVGERGLRLAELLVLRAMICSTAGDTDGGRDDIAEALALSGPEGNLRVLLESGPVIAALLRVLPAKPYCDLVLSAVRPAEAAQLATRPRQAAAQGRRAGRQTTATRSIR